MTLNEFIARLQNLRDSTPEAGNMQVYYRHGASGDCGELSNPYVTDDVNECGPFDLADREKYVSIYAGC